MMQDRIPGPQKIVVVVEDDDLLRSLMVEAIQRLDLEVFDFATADDALIYVMSVSGNINLVVADLTVPGQLDGAELSGMLAARYSHIPFILTTGYLDAHRRLSERVRFLYKPWSLNQFTDFVLGSIYGFK